ncbi:SDR family oxidoreductase [uncultured Cohaesibacter sp.]|uniref:SDR family oxidoreductase n=1 Tax=uncultured Cohaesibacter sp. TaxID=1002546 RepID=UPI00292FB819|nr:SDR family oxidoreductase [uncultured Cohaesibacter sp.]
MKQCLITGANRGIGLELARSYLRRGWHIHACCRNPQKAGDLHQLVADNLGKVTLHSLDVTKDVAVAALAETLKGKPIDLLINNAGIKGSDRQSLDDVDYGEWAEVFAVNTMAPLRVVQALLPNLKASDNAKIVTISSQLGALSYPGGGRYVYRSTKGAVNMVMTLLARDLKPEGITCLLFHPGWVKTDMGGEQADITARESAEGIASTTDNMGLKDTGRFLKWNGESHDW